MGVIYKVTYKHDPNTIYVGKTVLSLEERRRQHERNPKVWGLPEDSFDKVLLKKGLDNWDWEIIESNLETDEELDRAEKSKIMLYQEAGFKLLNKMHNPDMKGSSKDKVNFGTIKSWDPENKGAHFARHFTGKIKPVINLTNGKKYKGICELTREEHISTIKINELCVSGAPHPQNGNQYAFLAHNGDPIINEGHKKQYPLLQKIEIVEIKTGEKHQVDLFKAASIIKCQLNALTKMKMLNLGGDRPDLSCNGFIVFTLDENGDRVVSAGHKKILEKMDIDCKDIIIWLWSRMKSKWEFVAKVKGCSEASKYLADKICHPKPSSLSSKIIEILEGGRTSIKGYSFTTTTNPPASKPRLKFCPVLLLDSGSGEISSFDNANIAAKKLGLNSKAIVDCCNGSLNTTGGYRFAWSTEHNDPLYTEQHEKYLRKKTGLGLSVYWVEGDQSFRSIAELKRYLDKLCSQNDERVPYVPKREILSKIAKGELSGYVGKGRYRFPITLKQIK